LVIRFQEEALMQETKRDGFIRLMHLLVDGLAQDISEIDGANSEQYGELFHVFLSAVRRNAEAELTCCDRIMARATELFEQQN
jgi:hypothetical protein